MAGRQLYGEKKNKKLYNISYARTMGKERTGRKSDTGSRKDDKTVDNVCFLFFKKK